MTTKKQEVRKVPNLRFPGFEGEWVSKKLQEVTTYVDYRGKAPIKTDAGHFLVTAKNIKKGFIDYENSKEYVSKKDYLSVMSKGLPEIGDVLFTTEAPMGNVAQVNDKNIALAQRVIKFSGGSYLENSYLLYYMLSDVFQKKISEKAIGTTVQGISGKELHQIYISYPQISEQEKIATFLSLIDERIQCQIKIIEGLKSFKNAVSKKIFSQELRFKDENGEEFEDWEEENGGDIFENISNKNHNSDLPILAISQEFGAVPREMINYQISVTDKSIESYKVVEIGDFIISLRSFQGGIEYSNYKGICSPAYVILRAKTLIDNTFYKYYFKTDFYIQQLCSKLEGIRDGKMISYKYFSEITLPFPPLAEQNKIADFLTGVDEKIELETSLLQQLKLQKQYFLQQMFI